MNEEQKREVEEITSFTYDMAKVVKDDFLQYFGHRLLELSKIDNNICLDLMSFILQNIVKQVQRAEKEGYYEGFKIGFDNAIDKV